MSEGKGASAKQTGLSSPTEPCSTVSALTGFDPSRKDDVFQIQLDMQTRRNFLSNGVDAASALRWLHEYGGGVISGRTQWGTEFDAYEDAQPYIQEAQRYFASQMLERAKERATDDIEHALASAIEARRAIDAEGGVVADESAVPKADAQ
jgi:hypothetical protein